MQELIKTQILYDSEKKTYQQHKKFIADCLQENFITTKQAHKLLDTAKLISK